MPRSKSPEKVKPAFRPGAPANVCTVPGCDRGVRAKGLCVAHYNADREGRAFNPLPSRNSSSEG